MARPSAVPGWDGSTNLTEPSAGKKTTGWILGESPPSSFANWFWNLVNLWLVYLDLKVNGSFSVNLRPGLLARGQTLAANERMLNGWTHDAGTGWQTPAGTNQYMETSGLANHQMSVVLNKTALFERVIGPDDAIQIDSIDLDNERINAITVNVTITGSVSGTVFAESVTGASARTVDNLIEGAGLPKLDNSETWTLFIAGFPATAGTDLRVFDLDINATITTA